ncbi:MAG: hypothetical protein GX639_11995 [Fibrobacter sp.]|nr:hypothetical protein [Fibrobacter sp.]
MRFCLVGVGILFYVLCIFAEVKLSGDVDDMTLVMDQNPYVITDDVVIPPGKKLVISRGCIILFKPFTGITVSGSLLIQGDPEKPVVFTTENDNKFNHVSPQFPNPFDWNGILINANATEVIMSNFIVKYSVYGVKSYKGDIVIENGVFSNNGQSNLTIKETMKNVADGIPYSYQEEPSINISFKMQDTDSQQVGQQPELKDQPVSKPKKQRSPDAWRNPTAIGAMGAGGVCLVMSGIYMVKAYDYDNKYHNTAGTAMESNKKRRNSSATYSTVSFIPAVLLAGGGVTFYFWNKKQKNKVSVVPLTGDYNGIACNVVF